MAGVTSAGFTKKTVEEIKAEIEDSELANIDPTLNLSSNQPIGQLNAIFAEKAAEIWELVETAYNAFNRDAAEGAQLDNVGALTGAGRQAAKKSTVTCTVNLNAGFSQPAGAMMANVNGQSTIKFTNRDAVAAATAGDYTVTFESIDYGPVVANAGTLTQITNAISGWNSITNPKDAVLGTLEETDEEYRQRQADELTAAGASTTDAIRVDLLEVVGVQQAFVFENTSLDTDATGLPGKAIECVIYDGSPAAALDADVAQAIWDSKPSGAQTYGSTTATATDSTGAARTVQFSRATLVDIYVDVTLTTDSRAFPVNGNDLVKSAIAVSGNLLNLGDDVYVLAVGSWALTVPGVLDAVVKIGTSASPTGTANLGITGRQIARFDTSRITVH